LRNYFSRKFDYNGPELGEKEEIVKRSKQSYDGHTIPEIFIKMYDYYKKKSNLHLSQIFIALIF